MQLEEAVQKRIINLCEIQNITLNKLSTNSGLPYSTIFSMFYGKSKNPKLSTILHICEGLNIELTDFFNDPLFKDVQFENEK
jgi:transcriptional regulator with XRE-family HTH domain